jgi:hypothetical protein
MVSVVSWPGLSVYLKLTLCSVHVLLELPAPRVLTRGRLIVHGDQGGSCLLALCRRILHQYNRKHAEISSFLKELQLSLSRGNG